jgi:hypothetical protein
MEVAEMAGFPACKEMAVQRPIQSKGFTAGVTTVVG